MFVINKTDMAAHVGADLSVMEADTRRMRPNKPFVMTNLKTQAGLDEVIGFIERKGLLVGGELRRGALARLLRHA